MYLTNTEIDFFKTITKQAAKTKSIDLEVVKFLRENPNPKDDKVHAFAEQIGFDVDKVETKIYEFATEFVKFLHDGKAAKEGFTEKDADPQQLAAGMEVEKEHSSNPMIRKKTALDHLAEFKNYYLPYLKNMEDELKETKK